MSLKGKTCAVTGAAGYFGERLISSLLKEGIALVHALDVQSPNYSFDDERVKFFQVDNRDIEKVKQVCRGVSVVFHAASFGMSGKEQLQRDRILQINVNGTENIICACFENSVSALVYTSTTNVVFGGKPLTNKDESEPYLPLSDHVDFYSYSKSIAEKLVLGSNNIPSKKGNILKTCALRPAGIYGEGEQRHFPRIIGNIKVGLFRFTIGKPDAKEEWVYVDNLVQAHILAAKKLVEGDLKVSGSPFFISDQDPINTFEFFRPILDLYGFDFPRINIPLKLAFYAAIFVELIHRIVSPVLNFQPFMTRAEVYKVGVEHYFDPKKSQEELGYFPLVSSKEAMERVVEYYRILDHDFIEKRKQKKWAFFLLFGLAAFVALLFAFLV